MAGRKPLPTHLKLVKGTARPHRLNKAEPKPVVATHEPPDHLDGPARDKFMEMAELLARHGVMTELDAGALARYVVIWRRWLEAEQEVKRRGPVVKTSNDNIIQNPFLAVANKCLAQMAQIATRRTFKALKEQGESGNVQAIKQINELSGVLNSGDDNKVVVLHRVERPKEVFIRDTTNEATNSQSDPV